MTSTIMATKQIVWTMDTTDCLLLFHEDPVYSNSVTILQGEGQPLISAIHTLGGTIG